MVLRKAVHLGFFVLVSTLITLVMCPNISVNAALPEINFIGEVMFVSVMDGKIDIQTDYEHRKLIHAMPYGDDVPVDALSNLAIGDYVELACFGNPDSGNYHTVAKLKGASNHTVTDIYGDCRYIHTPLLGGYEIEFTNTPDLHDDSKWYCPAKYTDIKIQRLGSLVATRRLWLGETFYYHGEACNITVTFHSGWARNPDSIFKGWVGPQSTSKFTIHLTSENIPLKNELIDPAIIAATTVTLVAISTIMIMDYRKKGSFAG